MLNGDDNENGFKTNRSNNINKKPNSSCSTLLLLISKKQICTCSMLFCLSLAVVFHDYNAVCTTKTSNFLVAHYFWRKNRRMCLPMQNFVSCVHVRFYFSLPLIFTLLAASISHFLTAALNFHVFLPTKFVSFVFSNSLSLSNPKA